MRKVSISASPNCTCKLVCDSQVPWCLTQWMPNPVVFTQPLETLCVQTWECSPSHVGYASEGCPASLFCSSYARMASTTARIDFSSMLASCQTHLCKHPSLRWQADGVSNRAHIEPSLEPFCLCLASYSSEDDTLISSRTIFPLSSSSQVLVRWLSHWLWLVFHNAVLCTGFCQLVSKS